MVTVARDLRTGRSIWMARRLPPLHRVELRRAEFTDVLVVGAGISGALIAELLASDGHRVLVVDRRGPALGSTAASTALVQYEIDTPLTLLAGRIGAADAARAWRRSFLATRALLARSRALGIDGRAADARQPLSRRRPPRRRRPRPRGRGAPRHRLRDDLARPGRPPAPLRHRPAGGAPLPRRLRRRPPPPDRRLSPRRHRQRRPPRRPRPRRRHRALARPRRRPHPRRLDLLPHHRLRHRLRVPRVRAPRRPPPALDLRHRHARRSPGGCGPAPG